MIKRIFWVDVLRTLAIINMIIYHACWDAVYFGIKLPFLNSLKGVIWERYICISFIFLSGFCFYMSKKPILRGLIISLCGIAVSLITKIFTPSEAIIFGILTFIGAAQIIFALCKKLLLKIKPVPAFLLCIVLFAFTYDIGRGYILWVKLPQTLYQNLITAFLGFPPRGFYSSDYFPLLPWIFIFLAGFFFQGIFKFIKKDVKSNIFTLFFINISKSSLYIYMIHQPIIYGGFYIWHKLMS